VTLISPVTPAPTRTPQQSKSNLEVPSTSSILLPIGIGTGVGGLLVLLGLLRRRYRRNIVQPINT
jgi:hypothetical protein